MNINNCKFFNKDALKFLSERKTKGIHLILTDIPYYITSAANYETYDGSCLKNKNIKWDVFKSLKDYRKWIKKLLKEFYRILKPYRHCVLFCNYRDISFIIEEGERLGFKTHAPLIWRKTNPVPQGAKVCTTKSAEYAVWLTKIRSKQLYYNWQLGMMNDVIDCPIPTKEGASKRHPTQKPLFVVMLLVSLLSKPGDIIVDPCCGSGVAGYASSHLNRRVYLNDGEESWIKVAKKRLTDPFIREFHEQFCRYIFEKANPKYHSKVKKLINAKFTPLF